MATRVLLAMAVLTACGRISFDLYDLRDAAPGDDAGDAAGDAAGQDGDIPPGDANLVFVTSRAHPIVGLGGGMADQLCAMHASEAGLSGTFRAWISTPGSHALSRIVGARGWARRDGQPVADRPTDVAQGNLFVPILHDERGGLTASSDLVVTATRDGMLAGDDCAGFTSNTGDVIVGTPLGTTADWTDATTKACGSTGRLYCFQVDSAVAVTPMTTTGRLAFVSTSKWNRSGGVAGADALCAGEATAAGAGGTFLALVASTSAPAASRFSSAGPTWVRRDGVAIAATAADVLAGDLRAPPNVTLGNAYYGGPVVTGASSITAVATATSSCADWTTTTGNGSIRGSSGTISSRWFDDARYIAPCSSDDVVYCFEQ